MHAHVFPNCCAAVQDARDPGAMQGQVNTFFTLRTALFTPRTPHFTLALHTPHFISMADVNNHSLQNTKEEPIRPRNDRSRNRRTQDLPFITGCSHFARINTRYRAPASSPTQALCNIASFMQPLQCILQQRVHVHAAITIRFPSTCCRTPRRNRFEPETTAAAATMHRTCPSSLAAATVHGKTQGFVL